MWFLRYKNFYCVQDFMDTLYIIESVHAGLQW